MRKSDRVLSTLQYKKFQDNGQCPKQQSSFMQMSTSLQYGNHANYIAQNGLLLPLVK